MTATATPTITETPSLPEPGPWWQHLVAGALALLGFFLPFSSAGISLSLFALLLLALSRPRALWAARPWNEPVMAVGLALLAYIAGHTLWTTGWSPTSLQTINRYHELLLAPVLLFLLRAARHRTVFFRALMAGAATLALAHWASFAIDGLHAPLAARRISAGFALAICAYLALAHAGGSSRPANWRLLAAFLATTVLFAIEGRTGHVLLLLLAMCAAWVHSPRRWRLAAAIATPVMLVALALGSPAVKNRLQETLAGSQAPSPDAPVTSTAIRIELVRTAWELSKEHAAAGAGYANYARLQEQSVLRRFTGDPSKAAHLREGWFRGSNPHNEYANQLVGGGAVALGLFVAWLLLALRRAAGLAPPLGAMLGGTVVAFAVGSLLNSLLMDFIEGHVYMGVLALLLAHARYGAGENAAGAGRGGSAPIRRVLVVATRQIGDVLLTTPLVRAARERWPQANIDVLGFQGTLGMLAGNPDVAQRIEVPARARLSELATLARRLWRRYDLALVADAGDRAHLIAWLAAPRRSGVVAPGGSRWWKTWLSVHAVPVAGDRGSTHVVAEKLALLQPWLPVPQPPMPRVVPPQGTPLPADIEAQVAPGAVLVHAPSMWAYKQWPLPHFRTLVQALLDQGRQVVLTGSASARDQACIASLRELADPPRLLDVSGRLDFGQLVTLLGKAALYIGPDTSVSHLAAATGVPVIAVFGPTNPMRWSPYPATGEQPVRIAGSAALQRVGNVTLLQATGLPCVPCGRAGCEDHRDSRSDCLAAISPQRVLEQATALLSHSPVRELCAS